MSDISKPNGTSLLKPNRRRFLGAGAAVLAAPFVLRGNARASGPLVIANWGGSVTEAKTKVFYDPFTQETGIEIKQFLGPDFAKMRAQVQENDVEWDIVEIFASWVPSGVNLGLYEKLDDFVYDRTAVVPQAKNEYAFIIGIFAGGITFAPSRHPEGKPAPQTWPEFWDAVAFPGRRGLQKFIPELLEISLLADGVPPAEVYPCDVDRAFRSLEKIKPNVTHWVAQLTQSITLVASNELDYSYAYAHRVMAAQNQNQDVDIVRRNHICGASTNAILKGTRNRDAAMKFAEFCMRPERQVAYSNITGVSPSYASARDQVDEAMRPWLPDPTRPDNLMIDSGWWDGKEEELSARFTEFLLG